MELSNKFSTILKNRLKVGSQYNYKYLADLIEVKYGYFSQSGVITKQGEDFLILLININKRTDATQYKDYICNSTLIWEGQTKNKFAERYINDGTHCVFIFAREQVGMDYTYYGMALPRRMNYQDPGVPSMVVFDLFEYEQFLQNSDSILDNKQPEFFCESLNNTYLSGSTTAERTISVRTKQHQFRENALNIWDHKCAVTGVEESKILIASHIKPWKESSEEERVDGFNSLILSPNYDKLFDLGYISFKSSNGKIILSNKITASDWDKLSIDNTKELSKLPDRTEPYLNYHNQCIFNYVPEKTTIEELLVV